MAENNKTPTPPEHLSEEMKTFYTSIVNKYNLEAHRLILLTRACECLDRAEQARKQIEAEGLTTKDRYGSIKPHPCVKMEIDSKSAARLLLHELGFDTGTIPQKTNMKNQRVPRWKQELEEREGGMAALIAKRYGPDYKAP